MLIERLEALELPEVELLTDFQLQVEYAADLLGRQTVVFVDASVGGPEPYRFAPVVAAEDDSYSSHALSPAAVLHACRKLFGDPPEAWTLAVRGYAFDLGQPLSRQARLNLESALADMNGGWPFWSPHPPQ
jgi:hydrogenase maturation protease